MYTNVKDPPLKPNTNLAREFLSDNGLTNIRPRQEPVFNLLGILLGIRTNCHLLGVNHRRSRQEPVSNLLGTNCRLLKLGLNPSIGCNPSLGRDHSLGCNPPKLGCNRSP